jgi:predicted metal-dependent phosphoesterase TrpH
MLKADIHMHTDTDLLERVNRSAEELILSAEKQGFEVIAITNHNKWAYTAELADFAKKHGILLIPGTERTLEGKHVLVYNTTEKEAMDLKVIKDLAYVRRADTLIMAPHPYFLLGKCLGKSFEENIELFDAAEYSHFYIQGINKNKKMEEIAIKRHMPIVGTSDSHMDFQLGLTYSVIDADKDVLSVINAIKEGKVRVVTKPMPIRLFMRIIWTFLSNNVLKAVGVLSGKQAKEF